MKAEYKQMAIIAAIVSDECGVGTQEMFMFSRKRGIVFGRQIFHYMCKKYLNETFEKIGMFSKVMGRTTPHDHASVIHGVKVITDLIEVDRVYRSKIEGIEERLQSELIQCADTDAQNKTVDWIVDEVFVAENDSFLAKIKELVIKLSRNRDLDEVEDIIKYQEEKEHGRLRKVAQSYSSVGVV